MNEMGVSREFAINGVSEAPLRARDRFALSLRSVTDGEDIFRAGRIVNGIAFAACGPEQKMAKRHVVNDFRRCEVRAQESVDFFAAGIVSDGRVEFEAVALVGNVEF